MLMKMLMRMKLLSVTRVGVGVSVRCGEVFQGLDSPGIKGGEGGKEEGRKERKEGRKKEKKRKMFPG